MDKERLQQKLARANQNGVQGHPEAKAAKSLSARRIRARFVH
jgi:hypothetical protein